MRVRIDTQGFPFHRIPLSGFLHLMSASSAIDSISPPECLRHGPPDADRPAWLHRETQREPDFGKALTQGVSFRFLERRTKRKGQRVRYGLAPGPPLRRGSGSFRRLRGRRAPSSEPSPAPPATCPPCQGIGVIVRSAAVRRPPSTARSAW